MKGVDGPSCGVIDVLDDELRPVEQLIKRDDLWATR